MSRGRPVVGSADDTLAAPRTTTASLSRRSHGPGVSRGDDRGLRPDGARSDHRQPDARRRGLQRRPRAGRAVDAQPARPDRRRDRDRQDEDAPVARRPAVEGRRARLRGRHQGRPDRAGGARRCDQPEAPGAGHVARLGLPGVGPSRGVPVALRQARGAGPGHGPLVRPAADGQGAGPQRHPDLDPGPDLQVLRRQQPAAARPQGPRGDAEVPRVGRGQADPGRLRRHVERLGRRAPAGDRRPGAGGRGRLLRRAGVRCRRPPADHGRRPGHHQRPGAVGRHGPASPVQHVHALDAGPAVREPARGRRPAEAEAVLLLRRGAPAVRRRVRGAHGPGRADRPAHPLEGRRDLLRHPGPDRRAGGGPRPARQPRPARAARVHAGRCRRAAQDGPDVPGHRVLRRRDDHHVARDRRGAGDGPVAARRADAAGGDPAAGARLAHGADPARGVQPGRRRQHVRHEVRRDGRPRERLRDDQRPAGGGARGGGRGRDARGRRPDDGHRA